MFFLVATGDYVYSVTTAVVGNASATALLCLVTVVLLGVVAVGVAWCCCLVSCCW